jgi:hypothetical protein
MYERRKYLRRGRVAIEVPTPEKRREGRQNYID